MKLDAREVAQVLREKRVEALYHANTVATSCSCLQTGSLLARKVLADRGLACTAQCSDRSDMELGLWGDVFMDGVDIHRRGSKRNSYGPVLLRIDLSVLERNFRTVWVTKTNPICWPTEAPDEDRYIQSIDDLRAQYNRGDFGKSLVLRESGGILHLTGLLREVILDDPGRQLHGEDAWEHARRALKRALIAGGFPNVAIQRRRCHPGCRCREEYDIMPLCALSLLYSSQPSGDVLAATPRSSGA